MRIVLTATLFLLALLAQPASAEEDPPRTVREGKQFRVVVHWDSARAAKEALRTVEALWRHAADLYGLSRRRSGDLFEVHLYRTVADYERAMDELAGGKFKRNQAAALWASRTAHVAMQPSASKELLAAIGLPYLTRNLLLHEAAHLVRFHAMANYRRHPDWLADGAAQWLKYESLRSLGLIRNLLDDPASGRAIQRAQAKGDVLLTDLLMDKIQDEDWYTVYAVKRLFFTHCMTSHAKSMRDVIDEIKGLGTGSGFKERAQAAFITSFDSKAAANLDLTYRAFLAKLKPTWSEQFRSLETAGPQWTQVAFPKTNAVAWRTKPVGKTKYVLSARVQLLPNYGKQANILLDNRDGGFVSVALTAGFGVNVFSYDAMKNTWQSRASKKLAGLDLGKEFSVRLAVDGPRLTVRIGDDVMADVSFPERKGGLTGPWGLGAQAGSAVRWSKVQVE